MLADVGIIGFPNAGKSTLISRISNARPKVAGYPFTTLVPNLGIVKLEEGESFVAADIPGLIEGASEGKGLGHQFLKHIERTKILLFLIDAMEPNPDYIYELLQQELLNYNPDLAKRNHIIVQTKIDLKAENMNWVKIDNEYLEISSVSGDGIPELIWRIGKLLNEN